VAAAAKDKLLGFEIGNEPDLFGRAAAHRPSTYSYEDYLREYRTCKAAIRSELPGAPFAGPDAAAATDWVTRFASDEGKDLKLLTHHYYRECASSTSTLERLLHPDPKLGPELETLKAASVSSGIPYRICETNSLCGGGKPGVSDTFGSALWALDFMLTLAWAGAAGVNMETGMNQLGWISWYSPIGDDQHGTYTAKPEYYSMLAFAEASLGERLPADLENGGLNMTAYATGDETSTRVTLVNKAEADASVTVGCDRHFRRGNVMRLIGPSLESKQGITLGGATVSVDGEWHPRSTEAAGSKNAEWQIQVPAGSAAILSLYSA
jgi:Glycosyl hydrolase family 79 C-terminal beta domain